MEITNKYFIIETLTTRQKEIQKESKNLSLVSINW